MSGPIHSIVKRVMHWGAKIIVLPSVVSYECRSRILGRDRALEGSTQLWALVPGVIGQYLRRAFLDHALDYCAPSAVVEFGTIFSSASARLGERAYLGPRCHIGWAIIENDVLVAAGVHIPSGSQTHGTADVRRPIREQPGQKQHVRIGEGSWIGSSAVVMADVGRHTVVGAGAVVTHPVRDRVVAGGVPARVLRERDGHHIHLKVREA
jgi:acetyltransferase-like isoleucine patch superfamily enzyme